MTLKEGPNLGSSSHDMFSKAQKERLDNLDQANQEIDRLRKTIEKLQNELQGNHHKLPVSLPLPIYRFHIFSIYGTKLLILVLL